jgi:hypothetical protein
LIGSSEKANMIRITTKKTIIQIIPVRENVMGFVFATVLSSPGPLLARATPKR